MHWCPNDVPSQTFVTGGFACRSDKQATYMTTSQNSQASRPLPPGGQHTAYAAAATCERPPGSAPVAAASATPHPPPPLQGSTHWGLGISFAVLTTLVDIIAMLLASLAVAAMPQCLSHTCFTTYSSRMGRLRSIDLPCVSIGIWVSQSAHLLPPCQPPSSRNGRRRPDRRRCLKSPRPHPRPTATACSSAAQRTGR